VGLSFVPAILDLQYGTRVLSLEKWVQCFQEERFYAGCRLGQFGAKHQLPVKIQTSAIEVVGPAQIKQSTRHAKIQMRKGDDAVVHAEIPP